MWQKDLEIVRRMMDAWNREDIEGLVALAAPEIGYVIDSPTVVEPGTRRGYEGYAVVRTQWARLARHPVRRPIEVWRGFEPMKGTLLNFTVALGLTLAAGMGGCGGHDETTVKGTAAELVGTWRSRDFNPPQTHLLRFREDGTWAISDVDLYNLKKFPDDAGTFDAEGTTLTMVSAGKRDCAKGDRWVWRIELTAMKLTGVPRRDDCMGDRVGSEFRWTWTRISP